MKIVIDSNILFSALLKADAKLAELILNPSFTIQGFACYFLYIELFKHKEKIVRLSSLAEADLLDVLYRLIRKITFINETVIPDEIRLEAYHLTADIDPKDAPFVALAIYADAPLWTGDRRLMDGLRAKGFMNVLNTADLLARLKLS